MNNITKDATKILWYDLRTKYDHDPRIYASQNRSIIENFIYRLFTQDRNDEEFPFPIRLIRSIFTNAEKIRNYPPTGIYNSEVLDNISTLRTTLENAIETCVGRIQIHVIESYKDAPDKYKVELTGSNIIWSYPVEAVKSIGFRPSNGEIYIKLFRAKDNTRRVCAYNSATSLWEKVRGIEILRQLQIHHDPEMKDILQYNMPDLTAIKRINDMKFNVSDLNAKDHGIHQELWTQLLPILEELLRETLVVLAQYHLVLVPHYLHPRKSKE